MPLSFSEAKLEAVFTDLLADQGFPHVFGEALNRSDPQQVLLTDDLSGYLTRRYPLLTEREVARIITDLRSEPATETYSANRKVMHKVTEGFIFKRDDTNEKDVFVQLVDFTLTDEKAPTYSGPDELDGVSEVLPLTPASRAMLALPAATGTDRNVYRFVTQLRILGSEGRERIPDGILYVNGLPLVVFEFKSTVREEATIHDAYLQITNRYGREIPQLFKYNAFCVISDGSNTRAGSFFAPYEFYYTWRRVDKYVDVEGQDATYTLVRGLLTKKTLLDVIHHFQFFPDTFPPEVKIICRYPQYYAARTLYRNVLNQLKPDGNGKGGTYFGATGCGKSYTMLFLARLLMKSQELASPTLVLITDRTDLDDQLSGQFESAKGYLGDKIVKSVNSRAELRESLRGRNSGGVFLTTIHKFDEDTELLSERTNIICISDEAHRSQVNMEQKIKFSKEHGVRKRYGFAWHLHQSLPNATYVGFTGTPIDATLNVFGPVVESYTMTESVRDEITVPLVREGRAAKVALKNEEVEKIEAYYAAAEAAGANEHQLEKSKKTSAKLEAILGNPKRLSALAADFVTHYELRVNEGATVAEKALFVSSSRTIAYDFYREILKLRPDWGPPPESEVKESNNQSTEPQNQADETSTTTGDEKSDTAMSQRAKIALVMTRGQDDPKEMYALLGTKERRKGLEREFKKEESPFKIAVVVDMWLTGFDVPFLDTIYIDKPVSRHNLIQTISRVNRKFSGKNKGLIVDYIGIKKQMNLAMAHYNQVDRKNMEEVDFSIKSFRNDIAALKQLMHGFDNDPYFKGDKHEQYACLRGAVEFVQRTGQTEKRFVDLVKRAKAAYDLCSGSEELATSERDYLYFYLGVRSILVKLTRGDAPDLAQMNARVREMIHNALESEGVEELFNLEGAPEMDELFSKEYLEKLEQIKLPHTKLRLLQQLLKRAIGKLGKTNRLQGLMFSEQLRALVNQYNDRREQDILSGESMILIVKDLMDMLQSVQTEMSAHEELGIDFEEKAFYDILLQLRIKYDFHYPDDKMLVLAKEVKLLVDDMTSYVDWNQKADALADLEVGIMLLLDKHDYPPITKDEVYEQVIEQAKGYKRGR